MKAALMTALKILLGCVAGLVTLYLILIAINLADEDLTQEAKQFIEDPSPPPPTIPAAQNAFYAFLGFTSKEGDDIHARGQAIVETYHKALADNPHTKWQGYGETQLFGTERLRFKGKSEALCSKDTSSCLAHAAKSGAAIQQLLQDNAVLVARYRSLAAYVAYENPMRLTLTTPIPMFFDTRQAANLILTDAARMAAQGRVDEAFGIVLDDLAFWRRLQPGRHVLIEKMVQTAQISADLKVFSELVGRYGVPKAYARKIAATLAPLTDGERDTATVMRTEALVMESMRDRALLLSSADAEGWAMGRLGAYLVMPFYQPNATFNRYAHAWAFQMEMARVPPANFVEQLAAHEQRFKDSFANVQVHWYDWYNPIGKLFFAIGSPGSFAKFLARLHDLDGQFRLIALQVQIKQRAIPDGRIEGYLEKAGPEYHDPYTNKPMRWDPTTRSLSFEGYGSGEKKPVDVQL